MKKTFTYREVLYKRRVKFTGAYCGVIGLFAAISLFWSKNFLLIGVIVVCAYTYWETYGALSNPGEIKIDEQGITFSGCGMTNSYKWKDIYNFQMKEFPTAQKVFLRVNEASLKRGRYWINYGCFDDGQELYLFLRDKEYEIHPNSIKSRARRSTEKGFEERTAAAEAKAANEKLKQEEKARLKAERKAARLAEKDK